MRFALTMLLLASLHVNTTKFEAASGVRIEGGETVAIEEGETLAARVVNAATLARTGLRGARNGDAVRVTLLSQRDKKLKLMHVASGGEVTYILTPVIFSE